ncbi:hypothetical protein BDC45DRAFT_147739 [Circinella umbellata]|nr:hypothetical protein BDC45DRAFT_147739 [Circinella umbellata]
MISEQQQQQQQQELEKLSPEDQIRLDFYGTLSVTIEKDKQQEEKPVYMQKGPAIWPDKTMYQGGHIRQQEEQQESTSMDINMLDLRQSNNKTNERSTTYIKDIAKSRGRAFFKSMAITRRQQEQQQLKKDDQNNKKNDNKDNYKQYAVRDNSKSKELLSAQKKQHPSKRSTMNKEGIELLSHDDIGNLMNDIYPESHWKEIPACQSLYTSLFHDDHDSNDSTESEEDQEKGKYQLPWTEKHRPICVTDLLGDHHAYNYLLDWLQQLKVNSHSFDYQAQEHQDKEKNKGTNKRQRREGKNKSSSELAFENLSLDGQQLEEMDEWDYPSFSDNDQDNDDDDFDFMMEQETRKRSRSRRQVKEQVQKKVNSNLMLIFGPHGVGKTASIYTAANQVGYEVFEIHPGMRRAGKDLMALVGEMTESHQVNFVGQQEAQPQQLPSNQKDISSMFQKTSTTTMVSKKRIQQEKDSKEDSMFTKKRRTTTATKSGAVTSIQKKTAVSSIMSHFARVKPSVDTFMVPEQKEEVVIEEDEDMDVDDIDNEPVAEQRQRNVLTKQSLILLEEVDILYEEDKGFWTAVLELVQKSKRPIIMTCNDTDMVPLDTMKIEKAIEIVPQTTQSLIPYLQLLCFKEGYIINPSDLFYLVATMGSDLRQLIHTLEMWCKPTMTIHDNNKMVKNGNHCMTAAQQKKRKNSNKKEFHVLPRIFDQYMGIESHDLVLRMTMEPQNQQETNLLELCHLYNKTKDKDKNNNNMDNNMFTVKHFFNSSDLGAIYRGLETMTFSDSWIIRQQQQLLNNNHRCQLIMEQQNEVKDQICGYHYTIEMIGNPIQPELYDIVNDIQQLNLKQVMHRK